MCLTVVNSAIELSTAALHGLALLMVLAELALLTSFAGNYIQNALGTDACGLRPPKPFAYFGDTATLVFLVWMRECNLPWLIDC